MRFKHSKHQPLTELPKNPTLRQVAELLVEDQRICQQAWSEQMDVTDAPLSWLTMIDLESHIKDLGFKLEEIINQ